MFGSASSVMGLLHSAGQVGMMAVTVGPYGTQSSDYVHVYYHFTVVFYVCFYNHSHLRPVLSLFYVPPTLSCFDL